MPYKKKYRKSKYKRKSIKPKSSYNRKKKKYRFSRSGIYGIHSKKPFVPQKNPDKRPSKNPDQRPDAQFKGNKKWKKGTPKWIRNLGGSMAEYDRERIEAITGWFAPATVPFFKATGLFKGSKKQKIFSDLRHNESRVVNTIRDVLTRTENRVSNWWHSLF